MSIDDHFAKLRSNLELNPTFQGKVSQHYNAVKTFLENQGLRYKPKLIGSLQRMTRTQPREGDVFDIDILVEMGTFYRWVNEGGISTDHAIRSMHGHFKNSDRYSAKNPKPDAPTITFVYDDGVKVEIVPAYHDQIGHSANGVTHQKGISHWVPKTHGWELADYDYEAAIISATNKEFPNLIPIIKQLKAIKKEIINDMGLESIHLEILATEIVPQIERSFSANGIPSKDRFILQKFFEMASSKFGFSLNFVGSNAQPRIIDPLSIPILSQKFSDIHSIIKVINDPGISQQTKIEAGTMLFGSYFPRTLT